MNLQSQPLAIRLPQRPYGQLPRIVDWIKRLLPAFRVEVLAEISLPVKQADSDDRNAQLAGRLHLVAGYVAKSARIDGQGLTQHELHAEVGDCREPCAGMPVLEPRIGPIGVPILTKQAVELLAELRRA